MGGTEVVAATAILFAFAVGIIIGVVLVISLASVFEDLNMSLWGSAPNAACRGARRLMGATALGGRPFGGFPDRNGLEEPPGPEDDTQPRWPGGTSA
jgi:hypothetical protein